MRQIVYALTGSDKPPPVLDRLLERFVQRMRDELEDIIWNANFKGSTLAESLFQAYSLLSEIECVRLFLAPEFYDSLRYAHWQANSDKSLRKILKLLQISSNNNVLEQNIDNSIYLHKLGDTIEIDLGTEFGRRVDPSSPVFMSSFEPLTENETKLIIDKLHKAFKEIDVTAPAFSRLILNYTRTIFVRKVSGEVPASEQVDTELGAIRLRNVHIASYSHEQLVDDLIHESVHNFLGTFEYIEFPFIQYGHRTPTTIRPVSPWSMRPIQTLPFVHACFVYFAMFHYGEKRKHLMLESSSDYQNISKRQNKYASGFLMPGKLSTYVSSLSAVDPRACQSIDWMEIIMKDKYQIEVVSTEKHLQLA